MSIGIIISLILIEVNENYHLSFRYNLKQMKLKDFIFQLKLELIKIENDSIKHKDTSDPLEYEFNTSNYPDSTQITIRAVV